MVFFQGSGRKNAIWQPRSTDSFSVDQTRILEYFEKVKTAGHESLFWYLVDGHNGTKKNMSRRFSLYLKRLKLKGDSNCFHSLRYSVITRLAARSVNNSTNYVLTGHQSSDDAKKIHISSICMNSRCNH
ncbi:hypothetical protein BPMI_03335c [Candidatus Burkholderia pumila]|uniref:Tyr recombinase domain-containing protein n=1 Tax=Candidatus Burkholderia pumila TaxID=1090375 RepID=A0ABR5HPI5_9BURK|nr:hypothetical protein BPMI_03335c [Candidatus Burkholderia pumila]